MNGRIAKALRKKIYGNKSYRDRSYKDIGRTTEADGTRQLYQKMKKGKIQI